MYAIFEQENDEREMREEERKKISKMKQGKKSNMFVGDT
jgi:hypothetical protein